VLVTHFMEEAERLCDRVAVFDSGRIVALDTPATLAAGADAGQRISFRPDRPLDEAALLALPEVRGVQRRGDQVTVTGTGAVLNAVTTLLARRGIVARQLRVDQASLEDAFIALTGRRHDEKTTHTQEKSDVR
jgi:ABC-2 type transport system ATP-binding protein